VGALDLMRGGRGGKGKDSKHPGGDGGSVQVREPEDHLAGPVDIVSYGNGGHGFDGCGSATTNATAGGDAGAFTVTGQQRRSAFISDSFNGGDGGDGHPPGLGGERGATSAAVKRALDSFQAGDPGVPCTGKKKGKGGSVVAVTTTTSRPATTTPASATTTTSATTGSGWTCAADHVTNQVTVFNNGVESNRYSDERLARTDGRDAPEFRRVCGFGAARGMTASRGPSRAYPRDHGCASGDELVIPAHCLLPRADV